MKAFWRGFYLGLAQMGCCLWLPWFLVDGLLSGYSGWTLFKWELKQLRRPS